VRIAESNQHINVPTALTLLIGQSVQFWALAVAEQLESSPLRLGMDEGLGDGTEESGA